jgi:hypothetical protein
MKAWIDDPTIILKHSELNKLWPCSSMNATEKFNTTTRLVLALTVIGYLIMNTWEVILLGLISIGTLTYMYTKKNNSVEGYTDNDNTINPEMVTPTPKNPLMNVLLTDIIDNPSRPSANKSYNKDVYNEINDKTQTFVSNDIDHDKKTRDKLYRDIGDTWEFEQSMRSWYTTPNTQVPNDQESFTDFCFGDMKSCKDGDVIACTAPGSMPPRWTDGGNP